MKFDDSVNLNLSEISTCWGDFDDAHRPEDSEERAHRAQERLLLRYQGAIIRYVRGAIGGEDAANDLFQTFCVRFLRGDFRRANPNRGRFRDYLKSALYHLVQDHYRGIQKNPGSFPSHVSEPWIQEDPSRKADETFLQCWREEMMLRAWRGLEDHERHTGKPLASVLRYSIKNPQFRSALIAEHFTALLGRRISADMIRKFLMDARRAFRESLVHQVTETLDYPSLDQVEEELISLGLHSRCREVLDRRREV